MIRGTRMAPILVVLVAFLVLAAGCSSENKHWEEAQAVDTIEAYESFLEQHPEGKFRDQAMVRIASVALDEARLIGTVEAYQRWLELYPDNTLAPEVGAQIQEIDFRGAEEEDTVAAYQAFLAKYPEGEFATRTREILHKIYPAFTPEESLDIPEISRIVAKGGITFRQEEGKEGLEALYAGSLKMNVSNDRVCLFCAETLQLAPEMRVPTRIFTHRRLNEYKGFIVGGGTVTKNWVVENGAIKQPMEIESVEIDLKSVTVPAGEISGDLIVSGPDGATLKKEGKGFRLLEGEAHLLRDRS